jgi:glyoxylase-like metal-dependent hydrolase (beta-lactamase superfamily II)
MHICLLPLLLFLAPARARQPALDGSAIVAALAKRNVAPASAVRVVYEGRWTLEAHLAKPHDTWARATRLTLLDLGGGRARLDWETWDEKKPTQVDVETTWLDGERVVLRDSAASAPVAVSSVHAATLRARVEAAAPWRLVARLAGEHVTAADTTHFVAGPPGSPLPQRCSWDPATSCLSASARPYAHPRLGDALDQVTWADWSEREGVFAPGTLRIDAPGGTTLDGDPQTFELHIVRLERVADAEPSFELPRDAQAEAAPADPHTAELTVTELFPGVVSFGSKALDARTVVIEFEDHCLALGAPLTSALGERIVALIQQRFPGKPLRYVMFGHHHPHYTGGLRAFLAAGATVVATPSNSRYAAEIAARPFTIAPDAWALAKATPRIESFSGQRVFEGGRQRVEAFDIGARSSHTDEYVVFYLPRQRVLLEDDIGWFAAQDGGLRFGARSRGLRDAMVERALDVQTLWQLWPFATNRPSITFAELDGGVNASQAPRSK